MKKLIVIFFLLFVGAIYAQDKSHDILLKVVTSMRTKQGISYDINYAVKGSDIHDTLKYTAQVAMLRDSRDTILGGMAWVAPIGEAMGMKYIDGTVMFYDMQYAYKVYSSIKSIVYFNPHIVKNTHLLELRPESMVWKPFLKMNEIEDMAGKDYTTSMLQDTVINGKICYSIIIKPIAEKKAKWYNAEFYYKWYINKHDYMLVAWEQWVNNGNDWQYENFHIKSYTFNKVTKDRFSVKQLPTDYKRGEIKPD